MTFRRLLHRLHQITALAAGAWLVLIGLTGGLLVFGREIDAWSAPELFEVTPAPPFHSLDAIVARVAAAFPHEPVFRLRLPQHPGESLEVWLTSWSGRRVYVDPYCGRILGDRLPRQTAMGILRLMHVELLLGKLGRSFVGICGIALMVLVGSGLKMWWPGWRRLRHGFRLRGNSWQVSFYFWHRVLGVAASLVLTLSGLTGVAMVFDGAAETVLSLVTGMGRVPQSPTNPDYVPSQPISLDASLATAEQKIPHAQTTFIWLPTPTNGVTAVRMRGIAETHPNGKSYVYLDGETQHIFGVVDASKSKDVSAITNMFYPLHTGNFGGTTSRTLMVFSGLAPLALLITGLSSWRLRARKVARR